MVRVFSVYYPVRILVLLLAEAAIICTSFLLSIVIRFGGNSTLVLKEDYGLYKILAITAIGMVCLYGFDLYDVKLILASRETYQRLLTVVGIVSLVLAAAGFLFPTFLLGNGVFLVGVGILTLALLFWRLMFSRLLDLPWLRERVYVVGAGDRADRLVETLRARKDLGMDVVGWTGAAGNSSVSREELGSKLIALSEKGAIDRVIVAMPDGRGKMPVRELLEARLSGVKVDDATSLLERVSGKIEIHELHPSWLVFSEGFRLHIMFITVQRVLSILVALVCLLVCLPLIPVIMLAIKMTSPGPALYRQRRVGRKGVVFTCYKFRTMRPNAEADSGPTWALDNDPRVTRLGRFLRKARLDELPQLWNVLRGDMSFVGPRPERPEFVEQLTRDIPYYGVRHVVRPGITGWAQIRYKYGNSIEDSRQKLQYDLFYIKNMSLGLDFWIIAQTAKVILLGRGAQ